MKKMIHILGFTMWIFAPVLAMDGFPDFVDLNLSPIKGSPDKQITQPKSMVDFSTSTPIKPQRRIWSKSIEPEKDDTLISQSQGKRNGLSTHRHHPFKRKKSPLGKNKEDDLNSQFNNLVINTVKITLGQAYERYYLSAFPGDSAPKESKGNKSYKKTGSRKNYLSERPGTPFPSPKEVENPLLFVSLT